jgi:tripartite-type tricarboxylate transporter receptor subunit TctC
VDCSAEQQAAERMSRDARTALGLSWLPIRQVWINRPRPSQQRGVRDPMQFKPAKLTRFKRGAFASLAVAAVVNAMPARADDFPSRPMTMIVPFVAGGPSDLVARFIAMGMGPVLGHSVIVENVAGAGGMAGSLRVAKAPPDGYVFGLGTVGTHAQGQTLYKNPLYNAATDFTPVVLIANVPLVLVARKDLPVANLKEFIAYGREHQSQMQYGSGGSAGQLGCVLLNYVVGINVVHVPYRGSAPALQDLQAGRVDYICDITTTAKGSIDAGTVKALAVLDSKRSLALPDLPTSAEQGLPDVVAYTWNALFLPKNAPETVVKKLHDAAVTAMHTQAVHDRLMPLGAEIVPDEKTTPQYLADLVKNEIAKWAVPITAAGATVE